jgi:predicted transcriptional regulator
MTSTTMTIRVTAQTKERLEQLARITRRSRSFLAAEAVDRYLDREQAIIDGIRRGQADVAAGNLVSNETAFAELAATITGPDSNR